MSGKTIRAFTAITPDSHALEKIEKLSRHLKREPWAETVRWIQPDHIHLTLRFIGDVNSDRIPDIVHALSEAVKGMEGFDFNLSGITLFPSGSRPRVLVVETEKNQVLATLAERIEAAVVSCGFEPEKRKFRGHLTLGRCRREFPRDKKFREEIEKIKITAREIVLYQSILKPSGAEYTPLSRVGLGTQQH